MADTDDADSTDESGAAPADRSRRSGSGSAGGSHAVGATPSDPDLNGVDDDTSSDELVSVGASSTALAAGGAKDSGAVSRARDKKVKATPKQKQVAEKEPRTGPVKFLRESVSELQKVVYPTGQQLVNYFVVVLVFVLFIIAIVTALDFAFGKAILAVFS